MLPREPGGRSDGSRGGRAIVSDIVCDEDVPASLQADPELWSGCVSGAFREDEFLEAFAAAGFYGITILEWSAEPWRVAGGIEFRSVTVTSRLANLGWTAPAAPAGGTADAASAAAAQAPE